MCKCDGECRCEFSFVCNCEGLLVFGHFLFLFHFIDQIRVCISDICALFHQPNLFFFSSIFILFSCSVFFCFFGTFGLAIFFRLMVVCIRRNQRRKMLYLSLSVFELISFAPLWLSVLLTKCDICQWFSQFLWVCVRCDGFSQFSFFCVCVCL